MSLNKFLKFHGKDATIKNYSVTGTDSYGDDNTSESTSSTQVVVDRNLTASDVDVTEIGQDVRISTLIYVDDEETVEDGEDGTHRTKIDVDNQTYQVIVKNDLGNGYLECLCERV